MNGFENLPCLNVTISSQGLNGTVELSQYGDFTIQNNASRSSFGVKEDLTDPSQVYQVIYYVDEGYDGVPGMEFGVQYTC
jgi:hypothetical protein